jgi:hypothetical protein
MQGFRQGWLMLLGVPLDYRNEYDLANAISSFGKFQHWHHEDGVLDRTLVFASFGSPALVPRDVVFGNYTNLGGFKESWTTPCYILTADFADVLPPDEDQMPANGNPHPLPGNLQHDFKNFVVPQFPELGWNDFIEQNQPLVQDVDFFQPEPMIQENPVVQEEPVQQDEEQMDSSIINGSAESANNDNAPGEEEVNQQLIVNTMRVLFHENDATADIGSNILFQKQGSQVFGPPLPSWMVF